jgi:toxin FitB
LKYALDTNVLSELRRNRPHGGVLAWSKQQRPRDIVVPAVVVGEIQQGLERTRPSDPRKALEIEAWLNHAIETFSFVPADEAVFQEQARLRARHKTLQYEDGLIAATASVHGLAVATRNLKDFEGLGIALVNPFVFR